jgi:CBS domain-containing protein
MKIRDLMTPYVETVQADATAMEAAGRMRAFDVGSLPVFENGELVGIVTDRDLALRVTAAGKKGDETPIREVMSLEVITCGPDQDVAEAARLMEINQLRRLPVVDRSGRLCGMVTLGDLARNECEDLAGKVMSGMVRSVPYIPPVPWSP